MRLAAPTIAIVLVLAGCGGSKSGPGPVPSATVADPAAAGKQVFASAGCAGCHQFDAAGSSGTTGPNLDTRVRPDAQDAGKPVRTFVYESIVSPNDYVAQGYPKNVMPRDFGDTLTQEQIAELVAFVSSNV